MGRLDGKVCVITGAGGGMGADAAVLFSEEGAQVCVADVNLEAAEAVAAQARDAFAVQVDVADESSVQAMYAAAKERYGGIDVLYNNAGISPADDDSILETDLRSVGASPGREHAGRLPLLQARHPVSPAARRRLGHQRRVVRRARRCGDVADLVHGVEGRGAVDEQASSACSSHVKASA